jgi:hypothetical protein
VALLCEWLCGSMGLDSSISSLFTWQPADAADTFDICSRYGCQGVSSVSLLTRGKESTAVATCIPPASTSHSLPCHLAGALC